MNVGHFEVDGRTVWPYSKPLEFQVYGHEHRLRAVSLKPQLPGYIPTLPVRTLDKPSDIF